MHKGLVAFMHVRILPSSFVCEQNCSHFTLMGGYSFQLYCLGVSLIQLNFASFHFKKQGLVVKFDRRT